MEDWRKYYNEERPHGAIGNKPPITLQDYDGAQPAIVKEAENSNPAGPKFGLAANPPRL